jgi:uncharacterized protein
VCGWPSPSVSTSATFACQSERAAARKLQNEKTVRALYDARARRDWAEVRTLLNDDVVWHEPGEEDYSGDHVGGDSVTAYVEKLVEITEGTFQLEPREFLVTRDHVAARIEWWATRGGTRSEGNEIAVYRLSNGRVAEAWFYVDGHDPGAVSEVFSFGQA